MERDEIIKALECCPEQEYCKMCPAKEFCTGMDSLVENAFILIKDLTEENERLKAELKSKTLIITKKEKKK